jgi:hypothetical protein
MKKLIALMTVFFFLLGCASVFNGTKETIHLSSKEPDTKFFVNNQEVGQGISATTIIPKKDLTTTVLKAEKTGCNTQSTMIETEFDAVSLLGILIDFGLISILVVDWGATGAIHKAAQRNYILTPVCPTKLESKPSDQTPKPRITRPEEPITSTPVTPSSGPANIVTIIWTSANIRSGAGKEFPVVTIVKKGDKLIVIGESGEWLNVRLENGQEGWISSRVVK